MTRRVAGLVRAPPPAGTPPCAQPHVPFPAGAALFASGLLLPEERTWPGPRAPRCSPRRLVSPSRSEEGGPLPGAAAHPAGIRGHPHHRLPRRAPAPRPEAAGLHRGAAALQDAGPAGRHPRPGRRQARPAAAVAPARRRPAPRPLRAPGPPRRGGRYMRFPQRPCFPPGVPRPPPASVPAVGLRFAFSGVAGEITKDCGGVPCSTV